VVTIMQIKIDSNFKDLERKFAAYGKQVRFAAATTLTEQAKVARKEVQSAMQTAFDAPTRWTLEGMRIQAARPNKLEAGLFFKDGKQGDPKSPLHYLIPQIYGGARRTKRFEGRFRMHGYISGQERLIPTKYAQLDAFGNMGRGQLTKILSQLKTAVVQGDYSNATDSRRSRAKRANVRYFWSNGPAQPQRGNPRRKDHLLRGVWEFRRSGNGVRPILLVSSPGRVRYAARFDFPGIVQRSTSRNFNAIFQEKMRVALATARYEHQLSIL
jgi:hypothetical protein